MCSTSEVPPVCTPLGWPGTGNRVRVIDISQRHVEKANADLGALGVVAELGDARQLDSLDDA